MSDGPGDQAFDFNALAAKDAEANDAPFDFNGLAAKDPLPDLSATQSFGVSAARSAIPAAAGLVTGGAGAEIGAAIGAVGGPIGMVAGGIVGGLIGGIGGGIAASKAQDYALEKLAPTWKDPIDKYTLAAQDQHPTASFLGGLAPFALTMSPRTLTSALPENATAIERIMSNPLTGRMFSGALQGGMEIGQEAYDGHGINWSHGAMAFGFGMVFYRPNALGEKLTHAGARPVQTGLDAIRGPKAEKPEPTIAEAGDVNVMGPGVTEEVFHGGHAASPEAEASLRDTARAEMEAPGGREPTGPDPHVVVRRAEPELFDRYDELARQRDEFRQAITEHHNPPAETLAAAEAHAQEIQDRLTAHIEAANGYTGGKEARSLRAELRSRQAVVDELNARSKRFAAGEAADTPELATLREKLLSVDNEMRDLAPQVSAAYRRAADTHNAETVGATPLNDLRDQMAFEHMNHEGGKDFYTKSGPRNEYAEQMASVPRETLDGYVAHGISATRDGMSREDALASILRERGELTQAAHPLPTAEERATGVGATRTDAPYILLYRGDRATGKPDFVIVNTRRAEALDAARRAFPGENIVSPSEAAAQLKAAKPISHEAPQSYDGKEVARPVEEQKAIIAADVEQQLVAAGRDPAMAKAEAEIYAARMATRSRLIPSLGQPEYLYRREGVEIRGQGRFARPVAGKKVKPTVIPTAEEPAVKPKPAERPPLNREEEPAPIYAPISEVPDAVFSHFPDMQTTEQGVLSVNSFTLEERAAMDRAGLIKTYKTKEGESYEGVDPEPLWREREVRAKRDHEKPRPVIAQEQRDAAIERRASLYDRAAQEQEALGELGDTEKVAEYRAKAAEIRAGKGKPVEQPAVEAPTEVERVGHIDEAPISPSEPPVAPAAEAAPKADDAVMRKWFGTEAKARAYLEKEGLGDRFEVVPDGKRFMFKPKEAEAAPVAEPVEIHVAAPEAEELTNLSGGKTVEFEPDKGRITVWKPQGENLVRETTIGVSDAPFAGSKPVTLAEPDKSGGFKRVTEAGTVGGPLKIVKGRERRLKDFGDEPIHGYGETYDRETGNARKDEFLKDARGFLTQVADILADRGLVAHEGKKGKPDKIVSVNESGPASSGEVSLTMRDPETGINVYALISNGDSFRPGTSIMIRTSKKPGDRFATGGMNDFRKADLTAGEVADKLFKGEAKPDTTTVAAKGDAVETPKSEAMPEASQEATNEPAKLDQGREGALEGAQPEAVPPVGEGRDVAEPPGGRGGADQSGNERSPEAGVQRAGGVGNDTREVPVHPAGSTGEGRVGERGSAPGAGSEPTPEQAARAESRDPVNDAPSGRTAERQGSDFAIQDADNVGGSAEEGGFKAKTRFRDNIEAIKTLRRLEESREPASREDQAILAKWVGWGGLPQAFERSDRTFSKGWEREAAELKALLSPEELKAAAASTRNAHYTSPEVVKGMWDAMRRLGFDGGRVLEPSVGAGNFFGLMPTDLRGASALHGVELDPITGGIAKHLYPRAKIAAPMSFVDYVVPDGHFDAIVGNPPFGAEKLYDPRRKDLSSFSIHNYFFARAIDALRPGGVMSMVVTNRFLDGARDGARQYIADRADLIGAIRLPNDAFAKNAGTAVTTDIIFLRKRVGGTEADPAKAWEGMTPAQRAEWVNAAGGRATEESAGVKAKWESLGQTTRDKLAAARKTGEDWLNVVDHVDANGKTVPLNEYFAKHPDNMLGEFGAHGSMYRPDDPALIARPGQDTRKMLAEAVKRLPEKIVSGDKAPVEQEVVPVTADLTNVRVGSMFKQDGRLFLRDEDIAGERRATPVELEGKAFDRASGMIDVRDAFADLRRAQLDPMVSDEFIADARATLNKAYDDFVKKHGYLNSQANARVFRDDPSWPQIAALEDAYDRGISAAVSKTTGEAQRKESAQKAAIFSKRTQEPYRPVESADTAKDALVASLSDKGRVDLAHMEKLYGRPREEILKELGDLVYEDPVTGHVAADAYLSGNVKKKLAEARQAAQRDPAFERNVRALEGVQPADIEAVDISVKPGAHWLPRETMADFARHISGAGNVSAFFNPVSNKWSFTFNDRIPREAETRWGTDYTGVSQILDAVANQQPITVRQKQYDGTSVVLEKETQAANDKVEAVKREFGQWIFDDDVRRNRLTRIYNDTFNTDVLRSYDGAHLTFPGKVDDAIIQLRPHQANAIWRAVQSPTTLFDHVVGAGKTFTMVGAAMEMRRMGLARKPMFLVPNHLVLQWAKDFVKLYPGANILAASKTDFEAGSRKKLFARVATGDYDAVIVPHSSFGKIEVDPKAQAEYIDSMVADLAESLKAVKEAEGGGKDSRNVKQIQAQIQLLKEKQKKLLDAGRKDDSLYFNELGADALFVDEAHEFKNLAYSTSMQRVAGLGSKEGSQKASDLHLKVQQVLEATGGRNVVFATGTPISNTMAEMFTMQRYLDGKGLQERGLSHFDAWARMFGEVVNDWEISPAGKYKLNSRFAKFTNMPELMQRYSGFADVINRDDIRAQLREQGKDLPVPKMVGGKPDNVVVDRSPAQADYIGVAQKDASGNEVYPAGSLIHRADNLPKKPTKGADNMLKIMSDARKAALDMRLIDPSLPDHPGSKVNVAAERIKGLYDKWHADKGTQLVFIDLSTPKEARGREAARIRELIEKAEGGDEEAAQALDKISPDEIEALNSQFSVYDDLKQKLIARGIPEKEIAFIHDANTDLQKDTLFGKVRSGAIRVLLGSTAKMGAGMNVQDRLVGLHHLDAPWRPSDLEQREGRIIRQGNKLYERDPQGFEVSVSRYATKETLDARMWQTLEGKANFIEQVRKGGTTSRTVEDVAGEAMNSAEMKAAASGNPKILEEMQIRRQLREMENAQSNHQREQYRIKDSIKRAGDNQQSYTRTAEQMEADAALKVPEKFEITVRGKGFDKRKDAGEAIAKAIEDLPQNKEGYMGAFHLIGKYGDWKLMARRRELSSAEGAFGGELALQGKGEYRTSTFLTTDDPQGITMRLNTAVKDSRQAAEYRAAAQREVETAAKLRGQIAEWPQDAELNDLRARHAALVQELRGPTAERMTEKNLPEGFELTEPKGGRDKDWTVRGPTGDVASRGTTKEIALKVYFDKAKAEASAQQERQFAQDKGKTFEQRRDSALGSITFADGRKPILKLMRDADASTVIHEFGHDFLEQMIRDTAHPEAPESLRADMTTLRKWLGAAGDAEIETKHHEKFARGFEQYMREGVAPSRGLAHVFAQFKNWLTQIYQTIKGLGEPISDDVRRVFDRMLEADPQHTVIAPERASGPTIHDIHAEEARYTEPHEAAPAAERVDYERARAEEELKPEVRDELAQVVARQEAEREVKAAGAAAGTEPGSEARAGEGGSGEVEPGGGRPEPISGGGAGGEGSGKVGGGFRAPMGESSGVSERPRPGSDSNPLAPRPTDLIERPDSGLTDKAGNIRLENLTSVEDVRQAMREAADAHGGFMKERRGVITDGEIQDAAYDLGMVGAERIARDRILGQAFSAEEILALRLAVRTAAGEVGRLAKIANPSDEQVMQFVAARERQVVLQAAVSQATAEWGRAGRALRNITHLPEGMGGDLGQMAQQVTGKTLFQIKEEMKVIAAMDTPQQVAKWMVDSQKRSIGRGLLEYFVNNLISGVATHVTYVAGNAALLTEKLGVITPVAAVIAKMRGREGEYVRMGEVQAGWKAMLDAMPAAIKGTVDAARSSTNIKMPGETHGPMNPFDMYGDAFPQAVADFETKWRDVAPDVSGMFRGMRDGLMSIGSLSKAGLFDKDAPWFNAKYSHLGVIPDIQIKGANLLPVGSVVRAPSRMVAAIHATFRVLNYSIDLAQQSYRMAAAEGLTGDALARRVGELRNAPTEDMMQAARTTASDLTVIGQSGEFMRRVSALTAWETELPVLGSIQPLKFIDPFVHIAGQIVKKSVGEQSPLALLSSSVRADLAGHNGPVAQDMTAAKIMVGTALGVTVMGLAAQGLVSGSGPHDKNEKAMWLLAGNQAHSVRIGNTWYDVHRLGPLGVLVSVAADMYEVAHLASKDEMQKAGAAFLNAVVHTFMDEGFLRGPADLLKAIEDPARYGDAYIRNFATSFVPFATLSNQTARAMDPHMRQVRTMMDAIKNRIPGLSETLLPKRDIWGEPMANSSALGGRAVTAIYEKKMSTDPVNIAMIQHGVSFGPVPRKIRNVELDDQQYDDFARIAGRTAKMQLDKIVRAPAFQQLPAHLRRDLLNETVKQAREAGRNMIMMKYPQIVRQATQDRLDTLREAPTPIE